MLVRSIAQVSGACNKQREFIKHAHMDKIEAAIKDMSAWLKYTIYSSQVGTSLDCMEFFNSQI